MTSKIHMQWKWKYCFFLNTEYEQFTQVLNSLLFCFTSGLQRSRNQPFPRRECRGEEGHLQRYVWWCQDFWLPHQGQLDHRQRWAVSCECIPWSDWGNARFFFFSLILSFLLRWLVFAHPFFQGVPRVLEVGGYTNPEAWGVDNPYVGSVHPLKIVSGPAEGTCGLCSLLRLYKSASPDCTFLHLFFITGWTKSGKHKWTKGKDELLLLINK